jgi:hypothetical protein
MLQACAAGGGAIPDETLVGQPVAVVVVPVADLLVGARGIAASPYFMHAQLRPGAALGLALRGVALGAAGTVLVGVAIAVVVAGVATNLHERWRRGTAVVFPLQAPLDARTAFGGAVSQFTLDASAAVLVRIAVAVVVHVVPADLVIRLGCIATPPDTVGASLGSRATLAAALLCLALLAFDRIAVALHAATARAVRIRPTAGQLAAERVDTIEADRAVRAGLAWFGEALTLNTDLSPGAIALSRLAVGAARQPKDSPCHCQGNCRKLQVLFPSHRGYILGLSRQCRIRRNVLSSQGIEPGHRHPRRLPGRTECLEPSGFS